MLTNSDLSIHVTRRQHPVGQGFFHSATLEHDKGTFNYVYDCGSERANRTHKPIREYLDELDRPLDLLILSHLDYDHVSGIQTLLDLQEPIDTVVLPYLTTFERGFLLSRALEQNCGDTSYLEFVADPIGWLLARHVQHIVIVESEDEDEPVESHEQKPNQPILEISHPTDPEKTYLDDSGWELLTQRDALDNYDLGYVYRMRHTTPLRLSTSSGTQLDWWLLTFVHPDREIEEMLKPTIKNILEDFPWEADMRTPDAIKLRHWLVTTLKNKKRRALLATAYQAVRSDRNLTSLSLYSGPPTEQRCPQGIVRTNSPKLQRLFTQAAWIGTGDSDLKDLKRRIAFLKHFQPMYRFVGTMALPHHGSARSFHSDILPESLQLCVVSTGKGNKYKHPHSYVVQCVTNKMHTVINVREKSAIFIENVMMFK